MGQPGWLSVLEEHSEKFNTVIYSETAVCDVGRHNLLVNMFLFPLDMVSLIMAHGASILNILSIFFRLCFSLLCGIFFPQRLPLVLSFTKCFGAAVLRCLVYGT